MKEIYRIVDRRNEQRRVLESPFNAELHAKTFLCYCEVIIWPDGKIEYAIPSHNEIILKAYAQAHGLTREEAIEEARLRYGYDAMFQIMKELGIIEVWYDNMHNETPLTDAQYEALAMLLKHGCISAKCFDSYSVM